MEGEKIGGGNGGGDPGGGGKAGIGPRKKPSPEINKAHF